MKAIVNVNKHSAYADMNGLTFEVKKMSMSQIDLIVEDKTIPFTHTEVIICDFQKEMARLSTPSFSDNNSSPDGITHPNLIHYVIANQISYTHISPKN